MSTTTEFLAPHSGLSLTGYYLHPVGVPVETTARDDRRVILRSLRSFAWVTMLSLTVPALALIDAQLIGGGSSEASATEVAQELLLLIAAGLFLSAAARSAQMRPILLLAAGFFATLLVRELDYFWDKITHGFWVYPAIAVAAVTIHRVSQERDSLLSSWAEYAQTKSYLLVSVGLLVILVLSRTFGSQLMWRPILGNSDVSLTKTVIQEGLELLGYLFVFWGATEIERDCCATGSQRSGRFKAACGAIGLLFKRQPTA